MTFEMNLFDTHAHLNDPSLLKIENEVIGQARASGVRQILAVGIDLKSSHECLELANRNQGVYCSVGIHPNSCHQANEFLWKEIQDLSVQPNVKALGETGLDCYWDDCPLEIQQIWFARHIQFSHESGLPLVVHLRESENEILQAFEENHKAGAINGIMHSFTGTWETAKKCLDYGMYISFAGMATFKNAQAIRDVAKQVPDDRILVETDSPYLTPHPHRGKRPNQPSMVAHTAECLAEVRGADPVDFAELTTANAQQVLRID